MLKYLAYSLLAAVVTVGAYFSQVILEPDPQIDLVAQSEYVSKVADHIAILQTAIHTIDQLIYIAYTDPITAASASWRSIMGETLLIVKMVDDYAIEVNIPYGMETEQVEFTSASTQCVDFQEYVFAALFAHKTFEYDRYRSLIRFCSEAIIKVRDTFDLLLPDNLELGVQESR